MASIWALIGPKTVPSNRENPEDCRLLRVTSKQLQRKDSRKLTRIESGNCNTPYIHPLLTIAH